MNMHHHQPVRGATRLGVRFLAFFAAAWLGAAGAASAQQADSSAVGARFSDGGGLTPSAWFAVDGEGGLYGALGAAAVRGNFEYRAEVVAGRSRLTGESLADDLAAAIAGAFFGPDAVDIEDDTDKFAGVSVSAAWLFARGRTVDPYAGLAVLATTHIEVAPVLLLGGLINLSPDAALRIEYRATWGILPAGIVGISFRF